MRLLSLLVAVLIVGWLAYQQLGGGRAATEGSTDYRQAERKAAAVEVQVEDQFADQAAQLSRMESGGEPEQP
jgi:hypothetical protein